MQCSVTGEICGICTVSNADNSINASQVLLGLNEDNQTASGAKCENYTDSSLSQTISITGLANSTNYSCYYMCYNAYPVWPTPEADIVTSVVTTQTAAPATTDVDSAEYIRALLTMALLLVF